MLNDTTRNLGPPRHPLPHSAVATPIPTDDDDDADTGADAGAGNAEAEDVISETGCRLCAYHKPKKNSKSAWERTFHACWDPNDSALLYVFSQNGMLKIINTKEGTENMFQLLFRRFASAASDGSAAEEKPIRQHWDKVSLIPGKPGEILFLMGVSNTLHLAAVPGSASPLAELTDATSSNYVYGTPVLQIYSHISRITSLCMSPFGNVFASGDENGYINFINCMPPSSVIDKEPDEWWQCPTAAPNHTNPVLRAHNGPIFSLQWLPIFHKSAGGERHHYLASGSEDRMVRVWRVSLGPHRSLQCETLMVLDTQSTHVLCLKAIRQPDAPKTMQRALSQWSAKRSNSNMGGTTFGGGGLGSTLSVVDESKTDTEGSGGMAPVYLCAGTEHGSVYMWRFSAEDCASRLEVSNAGIDDGTRLLAILHSSARPVINLAVAFKRETPSYTNDDEHQSKIVYAILV
jgi:WD40 repeat protein